MTGAGDPDAPSTTASWIVLTMGDRPVELARAVASIGPTGSAGQPPPEVIVVTNGAPGASVPDGVRRIDLDTNVGIPAGRNAGAAAATGELLVFLDDDAVVASPHATERLAELFDGDPALAVVSMRIVDPESGTTAQRHVPRIGRSDPTAAGPVTSFLGGACAIRAEAFHAVGGLPGDFFYALEETDLAWRLLDAGWQLRYEPDLVVHHPRTEITRHGDAVKTTARNRVWVARRRLPLLLAPVYVLDWFVLTALRNRRLGDLWSGTLEGLRTEVDRQPMRWRTVWRLTRLGRPPVI